MFDYLFEKRFVYRNINKPQSSSNKSQKYKRVPTKCIKNDANWFVKKALGLFTSYKACPINPNQKQKPKPRNTDNTFQSTAEEMREYEKKHGKPMSPFQGLASLLRGSKNKEK